MGIYSRSIDRWELKLATRDTNRIVRKFEWGLDWLDRTPANGQSHERLRKFILNALSDSDRFFDYETPADFKLAGSHLTFTSAVQTRYPENNTVHAEFFPQKEGPRRAVLVLPQWNADAGGHLGLCRLLNRFGITALRMSLAYHDRRMPAELARADYHVSSNVGRTIHASRQSVIDSRACLDWLQRQGYETLGMLGTSLGSCVAFITVAHDTRISAAAFNHVSMYFSDVVWTGISTKHVRAGFEGEITQEELREYWSVVSPATYLDRLDGRDLDSLLVWARHDSSFLPQYSKQVLAEFARRKLRHKVFELPCGHYTTGKFPFNVMDGLVMCRFLDKRLK